MSSTFEDVKSACFDGRPVLHAYYGEDQHNGVLASILSPHAVQLVADNNTAAKFVKRRVEKGEFPILQVVYGFRFTNDVPPDLLPSYLNASGLKIDAVKYNYRCWFITDRHTLMGALSEFSRCMPRKNLSQRGDRGVTYTYAIRPGEYLATFTTVHVDPLRRVMVA